MSASNTQTGHVLKCSVTLDGHFLAIVRTPKGDVVVSSPSELPEHKRVTVSGSPPRLGT